LPGRIKLVSGEVTDLKEDEIRVAFEKDLQLLEDGLEYVDSEVQMGTGRIDTLAIDEKNRPVFIEYKRRGEFDKDALVQLMDYLSWFVRDEMHLAHLEKYIRKRKPALEELNPEIKMMCVVSDVEDRVKNACYVITNPMQLVTYTMITDEKGDTLIVPRVELDNTERVEVGEELTESEIVRQYANLSDIYQDLKKYMLSLSEVESYISGRTVRFRRRRVFANAWFTRKWITLELFVGEGNVQSENFKYWRSGRSDWGYVHITPKEGLTHDIQSWIEKAHDNAG
jgi:hypothetical protein